ncbi:MULTISPECIES: hypothetical protein [Microbulbifer]|uniref:Uncharacterized protein n=1 Tax=Microbulbifer celer TaxID=435905 RepID=A0ABW3U713_9GAMM|nr:MULTISPECIES: hypothetical protein [Microbulbifer]UFN58506.1 hypothetical protein LPW13_05535 [Microbulbifer celer]
MKKLIIPAIAIAAVGGYLYYTNLETSAPEMAKDASREEAIANEMEAAVAEAQDTDVEVAEEMMAAADGDVFADVPEAMSDSAEDVMDEVAEAAEEIDHASE